MGTVYKHSGLVALVGSSDVGKSSFLRQLAVSIALKKTDFIGSKLNVRYGRVIYLTTEDSQVTIKNLLKKQLPVTDPKELTGLCYIFNSDNPLKAIEEQLNVDKTDLVIIDCFADIFEGQMNDISSVRKYLNKFDKLGLEHECAFIFLHHNGKRTELSTDSNNIIGSQGFEAKMRMVMEIRKNGNGNNRQLYFTKGNYLPEDKKKKHWN
ncbi:MAG: AAA family ATPase [Cytophagaceae bacterium]|nr:AAA family ATPase [Cytophagaceae bacterium]